MGKAGDECGMNIVTSEKELLQMVRQLAKLKQYHVYHTFNSYHSEAGFPDLTIWKDKRLIFAELKTEKGKLTQEQKDTLESLASTGNEVYLWRPSNWNEITEVLS